MKTELTVAAVLAAIAIGCGPRPESAEAVRGVVLISVDTCRADRLSSYGFPERTTPHIDAVAATGTLGGRLHPRGVRCLVGATYLKYLQGISPMPNDI